MRSSSHTTVGSRALGLVTALLAHLRPRESQQKT
jgi:hypothetical protein